MSLRIKEGSDWVNLSTVGDEMVLCCKSIDLDFVVKARVVPFSGDRSMLYKVFMDRTQSDAVILDYCRERNLFGDWMCDSYVCTDSKDVYRSFYYKCLDKHYIVIEMLTSDNKVSVNFRKIIPSLIDSLDYSLVDEKNLLRIDDITLTIETPSTFRFSTVSTPVKLIFIGENKHLFVNVLSSNNDLDFIVQKYVKDAQIGLKDCSVQYEGCGVLNEVEWAKYRSVNSNGVCSFGTYFRNGTLNEKMELYQKVQLSIIPKRIMGI